MEGLWDDELFLVIDDHPEDWDLDGISPSTQALRRYEARNLVDARKSHTELAAKAASANIDILKADLAQGALDLQTYTDAVARAKSDNNCRVCRCKRQRHEHKTQQQHNNDRGSG